MAQDAAWREEVVKQHPIVGRVAATLKPKPVIAPESQSTRAWSEGAAGEELVGPLLAACQGVVVLHDRRIPKSRANIDHLVVGPGGVFVIDPKNYSGLVEKRDLGGWLRRDERLFVNGRDQTKLVEGVNGQVRVVQEALGEEVPVHPVLCFVGPNWRRFFARPLRVRGVSVLWPAKVAELVAAPGDLTTDEIQALGTRLASFLKPA